MRGECVCMCVFVFRSHVPIADGRNGRSPNPLPRAHSWPKRPTRFQTSGSERMAAAATTVGHARGRRYPIPAVNCAIALPTSGALPPRNGLSWCAGAHFMHGLLADLAVSRLGVRAAPTQSRICACRYVDYLYIWSKMTAQGRARKKDATTCECRRFAAFTRATAAVPAYRKCAAPSLIGSSSSLSAAHGDP